jgi:tetratricopeptide (TPR) repeat protein
MRAPSPPCSASARLALQDDRKEDALALVRKAVAQQVRLLGDVLRLLDNNAEALTVYQRILKLHPAQVQAHVDLASLYIQSGKLEARKELQIARQTTPNSLMLIYTQALLEFREGK